LIYVGDCLDVLRTLGENSVDAIVTDPPYGLTANKKGGTGAASVNLESPYGRARIGTGNGAGGFMGMKWDADVPSVEIWAECLRVLKPGGYLLAFAGTRTQHRMAVRIEDAGFEIRDLIAWVYGSGFPKSHNGEWGGTALKPALEPITVARKPLIGTVEANWLAYGTGALNIEGCRVATAEDLREGAGRIPCRNNPEVPRGREGEASADRRYTDNGGTNFAAAPGPRGGDPAGRWPANVIHDGSEDVLAAFPQAPGQQGVAKCDGSPQGNAIYGALRHGTKQPEPREDSGTAARFFYCAKASRADRNDGCDHIEAKSVHGPSGDGRVWDIPGSNSTPRANNHPTVKPTDLMRYLCRLVTPAGGLVLDPFAGSGSTGRGALLEGFRFIGIEREPEYALIAEARIQAVRDRLAAEASSASPQPDLFAEVA
jgi:DNA modification methylase